MTPNDDLVLAVQAARIAAGILQEVPRDDIVSSEGHDIKHSADKKAEQGILEVLLKNSPYPVLTEESGEHGALNDGTMWIVDPLDGTLNFSRGLPMTCVSIALWKEGQPYLGVVYDFILEEMFTGIVGQGAWVNNVEIKVSAVNQKKKAVLMTGVPSLSDFSQERLTRFARQIQAFKKVRLLGTAALSLAYVACGRADAYKEDGIMIWDVAAGAALIKAAGGVVKFEPKKRKWSCLMIAGANEDILEGI